MDDVVTRRILIILVMIAGTAQADGLFHTGLDMRTDLGTHHTRVPIGIRSGQWDGTLVLDPMVALDGEHDMDVIGEYYFGPRIGVFVGWRWSAIAVANGLHNQQRSLVGVTGLGPTFFNGLMRTSASIELATLWLKHGGGVGMDWISADRDLLDSFALGIFVRVEYARGL